MADKSKIEWTDSTWNPITGCKIVSPGCTNCYAMRLAGTRLKHHPSRSGLTEMSNAGPVWTGEVRLNEGWLAQPLSWKRPRKIFVCAHGDLFAEGVPYEWIDRVWAVMVLSPWHEFQVLTKRPETMRNYVSTWFERLSSRIVEVNHPTGKANFANMVDWSCLPAVPPNIWLGTSTERQKEANERIPHLLATPAAKRFVSVEPLLSPIFLSSLKIDGVTSPFDALQHGSTYTLGPGGRTYHSSGNPTLDWVIVGGESGPGYRPMAIEWANGLRVQCEAARVPFFFKQTAGKKQIPHELQIREFPR